MDMDRFKIDASQLEERSIIDNVHPTFYEKNKNKVWIIFLLFFSMLVCSVLFLTMWLKTVRERNLKKKAQELEALANQKLKLALKAGSIFPVTWNIDKNQIYI